LLFLLENRFAVRLRSTAAAERDGKWKVVEVWPYCTSTRGTAGSRGSSPSTAAVGGVMDDEVAF
jgi:hypothetical protein